MSALTSSQFLIEALGVASMSAVSYVSTNFDNLLLMSAYGAKPGYQTVFVKLTFILVCLTVLLISFALAQAADAFAADRLRYLGLVPLGLGGYQLATLILWRGAEDEPTLPESQGPIGFSAYLAFALVLLANSSDSVGVMTPLLADLKTPFVIACFIAALSVACVMGLFAGALARHAASQVYLEKIAKWALPFLLIGIGLMILADAPSDIFVE